MQSSVYSDMDEKPTLESVIKDWNALNDEFKQFEVQHAEYVDKAEGLHKLETECLKKLKHHTYRGSQIREQLKLIDTAALSASQQNELADLHQDMSDRRVQLSDMHEFLPKDHNGLYLSIILGSVNVSITNKDEKFRYKLEYEKFKLTVTIIIVVVSLLCYIIDARVMDALLKFLMVWYYCTLTIRESILRLNGSRIKGWWVFHHYVSCVLCGILLTWADGECYQAFRRQFIVFTLYISFVQLMQSQYQKGCLYRLRSLGQRHTMDITFEGFHSWMFKGLTFLLPILIIGYAFQFYNAYCLYKLTVDLKCQEWQPILCLAFLFLLLGAGNSFTTGRVIWKKLNEKTTKRSTRRRMETKYSVAESPFSSPAGKEKLKELAAIAEAKNAQKKEKPEDSGSESDAGENKKNE